MSKNIIRKLLTIISWISMGGSLLWAQTWNFNDGSIPSDLTVTNGAVQTGTGSGVSGYFTGTHLNFNGANDRSLTLPTADASNGNGTLTFKFIYGSDSNGGEDPDSSPSEEVGLYYSTDNGSTWTRSQYLTPFSDYFSWTSVTVNLIGALANSSIKYKLEQERHNGAGWDNWGIDDLVLSTTDITAPTITATTVTADNSTIAVTFSEAVYADINNNTAPVVGDFALSLSGGQATLSSATPSSISTSGGPGSLSFDGTNDYVALSKVDVSSTNGFSFSLWVQKKTGLPSSGSFETVLRQDINGNPDYLLQFTPTQLAFGLKTQNSGYSELKVNISSSNYVDKWVHIAGTLNNTNSYSYLYVNGVKIGENNNNSGTVTNTTNHVLHIGNSPHSSGSEFFDGLIDEVAIWDEKLTDSEIAALYNSGNGLSATSNYGSYTSSSGLEGYWKMDEGTGTSVADASANSNTATITGAAWSTVVTPSNIFTLGLPLAGTANGGETITVVPSGSTAIYDASDNAASTTQSNNTVILNDKSVAGTPTGLTAVSFYGGAQLNWTAVSNVTKYYVYYSTNNSTYTKYTTTEPTVDSLDISNLAKGTSYYYKVSSVKSNGAESNKSTATGATKALRGLYVATGGNDSNNGYSSAKALKTLAEAVRDAVTLDTIYIAAGTYTYSSSSEGNISFDGSKKLVIKGADPVTTILDANDKHRHFYFTLGSSSGTQLDTTFKIMNLTLKNGQPSGYDDGGSVYMNGYWNGTVYKGHGPLFQNVVFESNQTKYSSSNYNKRGGAVMSWYGGTPYFRDVTFKYNKTDYEGGAVNIYYADTTKTITFERTNFIGNYTDHQKADHSQRGGAIYIYYPGKIVIESSTFDSNYVEINGDCCSNEGGAIYAQSFYDSLIIRNSKFRYNKVYKPSGNNGGEAEGGAMYITNGFGNVVVTNSLFLGNTAESALRTWTGGSGDQSARGGAIRIELTRISNNNVYTYPYKSVFINNTFANNKALGSGSNNGYGGAIRYEWAQKTVMFNNIFWGNRGNNFGSDSSNHEIGGLWDDSNSEKAFSNNNFKHSKDRGNSFGANNISRDPQFVLDGSDDQYKLSDASFLIGAGIKTYESQTAPSKDILGNTRPSGSSTDNPDIGAYENSLAKTTYPDKVAGLTATAANLSAVLSWTANSESNISKYAVYQSTTTGFTPARTDSVGESTTTSYTATGLTNKTAYYFKLKAINSSNQASEYSDQATATPEYKGVGGWHVAIADSSGVDGNEGSKSKPMLYLSAAVAAAASGDTIRIGGGTHSYTSSSKLNIQFDGSKTLVIKGLGKDKTILDANQKHRHFYFSLGSSGTQLDTTFKIMDLTLKNGKPSNYEDGGSVYLHGFWTGTFHKGHNPLFQNVLFESNQTKWIINTTGSSNYNRRGGAVYAYYGSAPYFRDVTFKYNHTDYRGGAVAVVQADTNKTITFERTNFVGNYTNMGWDGSSTYGGAVYLNETGKVIFESSTFDSNYVAMNGSCCSNEGGAISARYNRDSLIIRNSKFRYNKVYKPSGNNGGEAEGGAIYIGEAYGDVIVTNSLFLGNTAEGSIQTYSSGSDSRPARGGAIRIDLQRFSNNNVYTYPYKSVITNNTFVNNKAIGHGTQGGEGGAIKFEWAQKAVLFNNIFQGNRGNNFGSDSTRHEIYGLDDGSSEMATGYNNFEYGVITANSYGANNISRDPQFVLDGSDDQYKLSDASFLIGAGIKKYENIDAPSKDILGNARPTGTSTDNPDMGAYENSLAKTSYPDKIKDLTATSQNKSVVLSWTANSESNISKYAVYQSTTTGFTPARTDSVGESTTTSYTATGLTNKTAYYFKLKAINSSNQASEYSDQATATPEYKGVGGWHVAIADSGGADGNEGSKSNPLLYLVDAVTLAASGDTIRIGGGTHSATSSSKWNIQFDGSKTLVIKGLGKDKTILDANQKHRHFYFSAHSSGTQLDTTFKIMDLTLKNGRPSSTDNAGSVYLYGESVWDGTTDTYYGHSPLFQNVAFESNQTRYSTTNYNYYGGAVYARYGSRPFFRDVTFKYNHADYRGGAVYLERPDTNKTVTFERTTFLGNYVHNQTQNDVHGGAVYIAYPGKVIFESCTFDSNYIAMNNGWNYNGGALYVTDNADTLLINNTRFRHNKISDSLLKGGGWAHGGAIYIESGNDAVKITNSLFLGNIAEGGIRTEQGGVYDNGGEGGAIRIRLNEYWNGVTYLHPYQSIFINNTFVNNKASGAGNQSGHGGAIYYSSTNSSVLMNNLFWGNEVNNRSTGDTIVFEIGNLFDRSDSEVSVGHNSFEYSSSKANEYGEKNILRDPKFLLDGSTDEYQLSDESRLIGAGALTYAGFKAPSTDILGRARPTADPDRPDMGAYENSYNNPPYPDKVINLTATPADKSAILNWDANIEADLKKYIIYQSTVTGFTPAVEDSIDEVAAGTNTYTATGLTNRATYYYRLLAVNTVGNVGDFSDEAAVMPEYLGPEWWVSLDGNDGNDGDEANPYANISTAINRAEDGHIIKVKTGTYKGQNANTNLFNSNKSLTFIGVDGPENTILDAEEMNVHFGFYSDNQDKHVKVRGFTLKNGSGGQGGSMDVSNLGSLKIENCIFQNNYSDGWGGALRISYTKVTVDSSIFFNNQAREEGGAIAWEGSKDDSIFISNTNFNGNYVRSNISNDIHGGALDLDVWGENSFALVEDCVFRNNWLEHTSGNWASGAGIHGGWSENGIVEIHRSIFQGNQIRSNSGSGAAFHMSVNSYVENCLFTQNDGGQPHTILFNGGNHHVLINNTIAYNGLNLSSGWSNTVETHTLGHSGSTDANVYMLNNIFYGNRSEGNDFNKSDNGTILIGTNNLIRTVQGNAETMLLINSVNYDPIFKNPNGLNFNFNANSEAIDAGALSMDGGYNAPLRDLRKYYRVGTPDLGAYEFGASKYILEMVDDIAEEKDTTFVNLDQIIKFTITTNDGSGNQVLSQESVEWDVYPNQKYVSILSADNTTQGGDATGSFQVTSLEKGKGFRFRIKAIIGAESFMRSDLYVIEEIVTGAPPSVTDLMITPSDWFSESKFTISWTNPSWERDLIGVSLEYSNSESGEIYNEFKPFPEGQTLTTVDDSLQESGEYNVSLWLVDELGNEDPTTKQSATLKFDNTPPNPFNLNWPGNGEWTQASPPFYFDEQGDYPSGIKAFHLYLNGNIVQSYSTVNYSNDDAYVDIDNDLTDGPYQWWMEVQDQADNVTRSDTLYFGVDVSPPNITHSNPLTIIDEGATTPTINASITDPHSGVAWGRLLYRRAGSGASWTTRDIYSTGAVTIAGSDVNVSGLEYYIETEDKVGNYIKWPTNKEFQSVQVRSADNISTGSRTGWSSGIPGGTDLFGYQLFSIPFDVGNAKSAITSIMGPADKFKYRLYEYGGGAEDPWREDPGSVTMGNAYFFIFDSDKYVDTHPTLTFNFGQGVSTVSDPPYEKPLASGDWTFFGSPYNYNLTLSNVYTEDGTAIRDAGSLYSWSSGSWSGVSNIQPWYGYAFKSAGATKLIFDGRGVGFGKIAKEADFENIPHEYNEWIVDIIASSGDAIDELNAVGVRNFAKDGYDILDEFEPPAVPGDVILRIDNRDREDTPDLYAIDIRKPNEKGHYWDLQVFTPTNSQRTYITFDGLGYVPEEFDVFLINKTTQQAKNLKWENNYRFANTGSESYLKQDFRLVIGTKDFVNENNAGVNLYPDAFTLSQNYPNPFNPQTSIMISLEEDAQVDLVIYNLLGEQVTRLAINDNRPAGYYTFIWNGTNDVGRKVSTGVYFYHAMIKNSQGRVVLNKTRKMIFLK